MRMAASVWSQHRLISYASNFKLEHKLLQSLQVAVDACATVQTTTGADPVHKDMPGDSETHLITFSPQPGCRDES